MELKKTFSIITQNKNAQVPNVSHQQPQPAAHSQNAFSLVMKQRQRIPDVMHSTLKGKLSETKSNGQGQQHAQGNVKQSRLASVIRSKLRAFSNIRNCEICEAEIKKPKNKNFQVYMCECEHKDNFCQSCLHHYVIYKVKTFEEVHCPREGCPGMLDVNTKFFKQLPIDIQRGYRKVSQFYLTAKDPNIKMCPQQNCEGLIRTTLDNVMVCNTCSKTFCAKCLLSVHQGECDSQQIKFFQSNLHYRQCKKCLFIIQKNQGCNHMTCRCGNQFCYVCGQPWSQPHYGNHDQNGRLIPVQAQNGGNAAAYNDACCDCECLDDCCGTCFASIIKFPFKLILIILFIVLMLLIFVSRDLLVIIGMVIICIFAGMFGFSFDKLSELDGCLCILGIIFFPILMIIGVGVAFQEIFCDVVPSLCDQFWDMSCSGLQGICQI